MTESSVRVAVRIRPQMPSEVIDLCHTCTTVTPGEPQVVLGNDKAFTFDNVFDMSSTQDQVYSTCIKDLINGCLKGYNATILAYGQTGSGKTYTMGTGFDVSRSEEEKGIIPRAVHQLFEGINTQRNEAINKNITPPDFKIVAQFMELYNEEIIDLLDSTRDREIKNNVKIHEDSLGQIYTVGLTSCPVTSAAEALQCLQVGALSRTTASTNMNVQSSRSHAIFTLHLKMQRLIELEPTDESEKPSEEFETLMAKLHFVDLAGSERLKRTGATGERAREGISINCGLLALGNVISALGDKTRKATHVPYRDSKLTRLLQDSLGGNSQTLMIACVSPSDRDFMETLNTLKYANRAKNIRNKISINQDKSSQTIALLRREIQKLQLELIEYKQGKRIITETGEEEINDMYHENMFLETENNNLRSRLKALQETLDHQTQRVTDLLTEKAAGGWITGGDSSNDITEVIKGYLKEIEELRVKLMESEETCSQLRKQNAKLLNQTRLSTSYNNSLLMDDHIFDITPTSPLALINEAKEEIKNQKLKAKALKRLDHKDKESKENGENEKEKEDSPEDSSGKEINGQHIEMNGQLDDDDEEDVEEEEEEESSEDSDSEEKNSNEIYDGDLAQLTHDISMKQKLIEALEQSQQRLKMMKKHYEEKLLELEQKIRETQLERDKILANLSANKGKKSDEKVKKVKEDFENKIKTLQTELRKMQVAKKEHAKVMRNQAQYERQIQTLKNEVTEMKKTKVRLINKMKEDNQKHLQSEQMRNREIAQLKKQSRIKENQIRSLQAENKLKENVLKRKQEELAALRKNTKSKMSDRVAGRVPQKDNFNSTFIIGRSKAFSPKVVKNRWQNLEKSINQLVISKQSISCIERDMERYLKSRENLTRKLENLQAKRRAAILEKKSLDVIQDYDDNIESLKANIDYCQQNIAECQSSIMQMEETKEDIDVLDVEKMTLSLEESKYLLSKLINMAINQTFQAFQKDASLKEMEEKLKQSRNDNAIHMELLERLVEDGNTEILDFVISSNDPISESQASSRSNSPVDSSISEVSNFYLASDCSKSKKRPRKTGLPSEFHADMVNNQSNMTPAGSCPSVAEPSEKPSMSRLAWSYGPALQQELDLDKTLTSSPNKVEDRGIVRVTSAPTSLQDMALSRKVEKSPLARRRTHEKQSHMADFSPAFRRKFYSNASVIPLPSLSRQSSTETTVSDITPPNSPSASRKDNVFSRLTSGSFRLNKPGSGIIQPYTAKTNLTKNCPLTCTHVAEGHSRAILSLAATDDVLFSSSKDRTVKIWDLSTGKEIQSLGGHPNNVCAIRYNEYSRLAFSVSTAYIKVWDVRENPAKCIQTLSSSGATNSTPAVNMPSRTLQMPQGESQIHDIALSRYGTTLFSAASNLVRIWDLRMYKAIGKLSGSYQAAIMCLAVDHNGQDKNTVVTGSKDHYIKVFEVTEGEGGLHTAKIKLKPPHYDGVQSLAMNDDILFSGSRDRCIKKWNLKTGSHIQSLNQAHKDWICALSFVSNNSVLLSGCRGGFLKLWSVESTQLLGEVKAHSASINAIATNRSCIFTASSDCTVGIWSLKNNIDLSPENNEYDS